VSAAPKKTAADRIREKAQRINAHDETERAHSAPLPAAAPVHTKPVRSTVDLAPARHAALKQWAGQAAIDIGQARVTTQDVLGALVFRLLTNDDLAEQIKQDLMRRDY
jgi:hypothetical protein